MSASIKLNEPQQGLFHRLEGLVSIIAALPDNLSDEEVQGLLGVLPPDTAQAITAVMAPHIRPVSISFLKLLGGWIKTARRAREEGRKVVLIPFNFPPEVIHIFKKAVPLTCEVLTTLGVATLEGQGERYWDFVMDLGIPDFLCSSSTIALGSILSGKDFSPDAIVQATAGACDANSKIHEFASLYLNVPQFFIEKPTEDGERGRQQHRRYFDRFIEQLSEFLDEELDEEHMRKVLQSANRAGDLYYDLYDLRKFRPCPVPNIFSLYTYSARFTEWGLPSGEALMQAMVDVSRQRQERGEYPADQEVARALWLYVGYYFDLYGMFNWMEQQGITYLSDALSLYAPQNVDTTSKQSMLDGLARVAFDYPMTRQMGAESMTVAWSEDMIQAIQELGATFAIYSGHHSCKQTWSVFSRVRAEIMKRTGVPVLCLQGDSWNRQMTPISVLQEEIGSFVDQVVARTRTSRKRRRRARPSPPEA